MPEQLNPNVQFRGLVSDMSEVVDEAILNMLDSQHPDDRVLASLAEARGGVVRMQHALKIVNISISDVSPHGLEKYIDKLPQGAVPKALPAIKKQPKKKGSQPARPGLQKMLRGPMDYDCPSCKAEKGTRCFIMTGPGNDSKPTAERRDNDWTHRSRVQLSSAHNAAAKARYDKEHFNAE